MRRYHVTTFGCQMNAHDSERIKGMLESLGLGEAVSQAEADVVVFNTCTIREKPDQRLAAHLAQAKALKDRDPERDQQVLDLHLAPPSSGYGYTFSKSKP